MAVNLIDVADYTPSPNDTFFFDNNIWMFLFCPLGNYKQKPQKFSLYAVIPEDAIIQQVTPKPVKKTNQYIKWNLDSIPPASKVDVMFELAGLEKGDFDENDLYIKNINPGYVIGADKWEGD